MASIARQPAGWVGFRANHYSKREDRCGAAQGTRRADLCRRREGNPQAPRRCPRGEAVGVLRHAHASNTSSFGVLDQPAKSLAIVEWKGNDVIVQLSPSLRRTGAKILIALFLSGGIASALLAIAPLAGFCFTMTLVAFVSGLCSTEITAGADRITLCHRLLFRAELGRGIATKSGTFASR